MSLQLLNRLSGRVLISLSLVALLTVFTGYFQSPQPDEGTAAHIFQLSVGACVPLILVFLVTADWKRRWHLRPMLISGATLTLAFAALYYLEHYFYVAR
jgi:hypothetical protein